MNTINYSELDFPTFVNTHEAMAVTGWKGDKKERIVLPLSDVVKIAVLSGASLLNIGDTRSGKSQAMMDIHRYWFGGDADDKGRSNWNIARNDFTADGYFTTTDQSKIGEGKGLVSDARVPVEKRTRALCNIIDEINLAIPEVQVEFFGIAEGRHKGTVLGQDEYHVFMASCNINRINGDFAGTSQINRALLNRIGVTIDFDYYKITDKDADVLASRKASGRLKLAPLRDISNKILAAHSEISDACAKRDPWLDAYIRIFSSGLDYCQKKETKKRAWPTNCGNCNSAQKNLCSLVKQSNTGTTELIRKFATGINYLINLKHPGYEMIDPLDLALEAYKFTTYHGNLNGMETMSTYAGEDQEQMNNVIAVIREKITPVRTYIDQAIESAVSKKYNTKFIMLEGNAIIKTPENEAKINSKAKPKEIDATEIFNNFGQNTGIRLDWLPGYLKTLASEETQ